MFLFRQAPVYNFGGGAVGVGGGAAASGRRWVPSRAATRWWCWLERACNARRRGAFVIVIGSAA